VSMLVPMLTNAFIGKADKPTDDELSAELGPARALWDQLLADLADEHDITIQEWNSYSRKAGWSLRMKRDKRAIVYLTPSHGCFMASFALGGKAVEAARNSGLPARVIRIIDEAKRYAEGTAVRIDVTGPKDIAVVKKLAAVKVGN
jgi:Protein of unknown function (DUF3788)